MRFRSLAYVTLLVGWMTPAEAAAPGQTISNVPVPALETPALPPGTTSDEAEAANGETPAPESAAPEPDETAPPVASPYQAIIARNAFGLRTPPPPAPPPEQPGPQVTPSALKLTGIVTLLGGRRAAFVLQEPGKPQFNSDLIREGEKYSDGMITNLEVLQIDERAGAVRVVYGGKELTLDFVNNGLKPPTAPTPAPGAPGAVPGRPVAVAGQPGVVARPAGAVSTVGSGVARPVSQPTFPSTYQPATPATLTSPNPSGLQSIPTRPTRMSLGSSGAAGMGTVANPAQPIQPEIPPPEQQALLMRLQEEVSRRQGVPFPPSPPLPGIDPPPTPEPTPMPQ